MLRATGIDGRAIGLSSRDVESLRAALRGVLLQPGEAGYDEARAMWNGMIDRRPALVARCIGTSDVIACVDFARSHEMLLCVKGGGHNVSGLAVADGALMCDLSPMRGVFVDAQARRARAQAGCLLGDVDAETQLHGLAATLGFVSTTGIAGLTLGGGIGYLTRRFGWSCDGVVSFELVDARGERVRASSREHADLFWALRGGGGNFGVVTSFEYELNEVGPSIAGGAIAWPMAQASDVLAMHRAITSSAPPEQACVAVLRPAPPAPWLPAEIHGKPIIALFVCDTGPLEQAEARLARIKAFARPAGDVLQRRSYVSQQQLLDMTQPKGRRYYWKSEYLPGLDTALLEALRSHADTFVSPHSAIIVFPLGARLGERREDDAPMGNRDAKFLFNVMSSWERPEEDALNIAWTREVWRDLRRFSTGGTYVNFLTEDEGEERIHAAYRSTYERLVEVKTRWDPRNRFRVNKNIQPRQAGPVPGSR